MNRALKKRTETALDELARTYDLVRELLLQRMALLEVDRALFRQAGLLGPATMRSLDAIHIAAAMSLGPDLGVIVTYDERLGAAAALFGLPVASPSWP